MTFPTNNLQITFFNKLLRLEPARTHKICRKFINKLPRQRSDRNGQESRVNERLSSGNTSTKGRHLATRQRCCRMSWWNWSINRDIKATWSEMCPPFVSEFKCNHKIICVHIRFNRKKHNQNLKPENTSFKYYYAKFSKPAFSNCGLRTKRYIRKICGEDVQ